MALTTGFHKAVYYHPYYATSIYTSSIRRYRRSDKSTKRKKKFYFFSPKAPIEKPKIESRSHRRLMELDEETRLAIGSGCRRLARRQGLTSSVDFNEPDFIRIRYVRYADDFLSGIVGPVDGVDKKTKRPYHPLPAIRPEP